MFEELLFVLGFIGFIGIFIVVYWKIFSKAGFSGWLSLLMFLPILNIGMLFYLAFAEWPVRRELNQMRSGS